MGGDYAPEAPVAGALEAMRELGAHVTLVGPEETVQRELKKQQSRSKSSGATPDGMFVVDAPEVVGMTDSPVAAVRSKRQSSIVVGLRLVASGQADAFVTAGNTGAAMAAAVLELKRIPGIDRPALAIPFPTPSGVCLVLDVGANAEARPQNLLQFAIMGAAYVERVLGTPEPRVGLLSIGEEESKGSMLVREAHQLLQDAPVRFIGNVEGKDIPAGVADVVVMDGFVGNVLIKFVEGVGAAILEVIRAEVRANPFTTALGLGLIPAFRRARRRMDYAEFGGAPLLGTNGVCIIAHGRSNPRAIRNAVRVAREAVDHSVIARIREGIGDRSQGTGDRG
jgi:glycerol-3-phosphate acyltransferase PlsX